MVEVIWQGHACFELRGNGLTIVHDPFGGVPGIPDPKAEADIILCSHSHWDHNNSNAVKKEDSEVLEEFAGVKTLKGLEIKGIGTFHDEKRKGARGKNSIYVYKLEGVTFCHLGDLGHDLNDDEVNAIGQVEVLFIPVGGFFTIGPDVATSVVAKLKPKINVPMHYRAPMMGGMFSSLKPIEAFTKGKENVQQIDGPSIQIAKDTLPEVTTHVLLKFW